MGMKLVSVIMPTFNRIEVLCDCIDSILKSTYTNLEIIVVDNNFTDHTVEIVNKKYASEKRISMISLKKNLMAAGGRNMGIKRAKGEYLLFVDNDNIVFPNMIEILVREMEKDENIGLVGPISINKYAGNKIWLASGDYHFFSSRPKTLYSGKKLNEVNLKKRYKTCYSPNIMMVSRKAINAVGGFDPMYFIMYEEADLGYRILQAGFQEYIVTDARTLHLSYVSNGQQNVLRHLGVESPVRAFYFARNRSVFMKKYAKWYHLIVYYLLFIHVFTFYYWFMAVKNGRTDIASAWIKGTQKGIRSKVIKQINIEI